MKHLPNDVRQKESYAQFYKNMKKYSSMIIEVSDKNGKKHKIINGYEVAYHNMNRNIDEYFTDSHVVTYARVLYFILKKNIVKIELIDDKGNTITKYYISPSILDFNINNAEIMSALNIKSSSTLSDDLVYLETLGIISRQIYQESVTSKKRHFSIDINKFMNFMINENNDLFDFDVICYLKKEDLQIRKIILYRILTIVRPGFKRGFDFQKFLHNQKEKLSLKTSSIIFKKKSTYNSYLIDPNSGEIRIEPSREYKEKLGLKFKKFISNLIG